VRRRSTSVPPPAVIELDVAAFSQSNLTQTVHECSGASTTLGVIVACWHQYTNASHALALLRPRHRPCGHPTKHSNEFAALHCISQGSEPGYELRPSKQEMDTTEMGLDGQFTRRKA
jgi:hypothetical protein